MLSEPLTPCCILPRFDTSNPPADADTNVNHWNFWCPPISGEPYSDYQLGRQLTDQAVAMARAYGSTNTVTLIFAAIRDRGHVGAVEAGFVDRLCALAALGGRPIPHCIASDAFPPGTQQDFAEGITFANSDVALARDCDAISLLSGQIEQMIAQRAVGFVVAGYVCGIAYAAIAATLH